MVIPTGLFVIATTGSLFGGIVIGVILLNFLNLRKSRGGEEKQKRKDEEIRKIEEWEKSLEMEGYEIKPFKRTPGEYEVAKPERFVGKVKDFYNKEGGDVHPDTHAESIVKIRLYSPEKKYLYATLLGSPPLKKDQYIEILTKRYCTAKTFGKVEFEPLENIPYWVIYSVTLKENPGSEPIWKFGKYKPKVDRQLTEFK